ncbi:MAG: Bax inhibitor-1/YccA family protein [Pseudomonadota bacterium]
MDPRYQGDTVSRTEAGARADIDQGLRAHMLRVYNYMTLGLALTGGIAMLFAAELKTNPALQQFLFTGPMLWIVMLSPLALVFFISFGINRMSFGTAQIAFWAYAALNGVAFSTIFLVYTSVSIAKVFFITAAMFGAVSLYGYTTKRDLSGFRTFLFMGVIGIIIAMVVNIFLQSPALHFAISVIGVLIFTGLTAYDTQKIKEVYLASDGREVAGKKAIMGALHLYIDFINIFLFMLSLFGGRE